MAIERTDIETFLRLAGKFPVLDVRSPGEFSHAHIPGAHAFPLFSDEERRITGTAYKQQSRKAAIKIGLDFFGGKMRTMVEQAEKIVTERMIQAEVHTTKPSVLVHCWRGGMRSSAIAWLLDLYGFKVYTLSGGYKSFRNYVLGTFAQKFDFKVLGGFTGSGKTLALQQLARLGENVIDLESLASHKGSAFGAIGLPVQPTQEMFENRFALELRSVSDNASRKCIWIEDESQRIGTVNIPGGIWKQLRESEVCFLDVPFGSRLDNITREYGSLDADQISSAILRIQKRLGGFEAKTSIQYLTEGKLQESFAILLHYYDRCYSKELKKREIQAARVSRIRFDKVDPELAADRLIAGDYGITGKLQQS